MKKIFLLSFVAIAIVSCGNNAGTTDKKEVEASSQVTNPSEGEPETSVIYTVSAETFKSKMESNPGTVLDVRTPEEVAEGVIPNAVVININDADFTERINKLDKTKPVYVYCKAGGRSARAADILMENGFAEINNLDGGIGAWMSGGYEIAK